MKIKTKFTIIYWTALILAVVVIFVFFWSKHQLHHEQVRHELITELINTALKRTALRSEYLLNHDERPKQQWQQQTEKISELAKRAELVSLSPEDRLILKETIRHLEKTKIYFSKILENYDQIANGRISASSGGAIENHLVSQIIIEAQLLLTELLKLQKVSLGEYTAIQSQLSSITILALMLLAVFIFASLLMLARDIMMPLRQLGKGIEALSSGKLNYRVGVESKDEIGELSRAFDTMLDNLIDVTVSRDQLAGEINAKKEAETKLLESNEALSKSEQKYRLLFQNQPAGFALHEIIVDTEGKPYDYRFLEINPGFENLTGLKAIELIGKTQLEIMPNSEPYWAETYGQVALTGKAITFENYSGELNKHYQVTAYSPEPRKFATLFLDITERKHLEKELHDSLELFALFMKYSPVYTYIKQIEDNQSRVLQISDNFVDMVGIPAEELRGRTMFEIFPEDFARKITEDDLTVFNEGKFVQLEEELNSRNYTTIKFPIFRESNKRFIAGFTIDITDRKHAEEEKLALEQQFQQTQKLESLGVLAGGIAHDFNNILAIIMGNCSLAKMDGENAENYIPEIEKAAERAAELCRQMLAYAGKAQFVQAKVNFDLLVAEMVNMLKKTVPQNAEIKLDCSINIPFIQGDSSQLNQIAMNLIINASEAIGKDQGEILVSLSEITINEGQLDRDYNGKVIPPGGYVCLEVTDNGCGMDEETKWRIFEPFYTTKFTGRGLGMAAVLGIIMSHKGALQLHSQLGHGTTFKVYLPALKIESTAKESVQESQTPWRGSGTILLVEDEDQVRHIAKTMLAKFGFTVVEAVNGKEALDLYQRNSTEIKLVLTDMGMPVMDGYALFHSLKQLKPELPIIISSGFGDAEVSSRIDNDDIAGLISKPYTPAKLQEVLKGVLEALPLDS